MTVLRVLGPVGGLDTLLSIGSFFLMLLASLLGSAFYLLLGDWLTPEGDRPNGFVQKPYNLRDLVSTVRHLIDTSAERSSQSRHRSPQTASLAS